MTMKRATAGLTRAAGAAAILTILGPTVALAQDAATTKDTATQLSQSNLACGAFAQFVSKCSGDETEKQSFERYSDALFQRGVAAGQTAGLSQKVMVKRMTAAINQMGAEVKHSCSKVDVLVDKYGMRCKALYESGAPSAASAPAK